MLLCWVEYINSAYPFKRENYTTERKKYANGRCHVTSKFTWNL